MRKRMLVAVIDSGVDKEDVLLSRNEIEDIYYEDEEFKTCYMGKLNPHGTEIIKVLLKEAPDIRILSVRTLREDNKCLLSAVINAIDYCVKQGVDVINLSLGSCMATARRLNDLRAVCDLAVSKGIVIFAADHNKAGVKSYPANFENVIGVTSGKNAGFCNISYEDKVIEFSDNMVYIPDRQRCMIRKGNSYLCPYLVGLYCRVADKDKNVRDNVLAFMRFLGKFAEEANISRIYFNKYNEKDRYSLKGKKILFFVDDMDFDNMQLYQMYREVSDVTLCFHELYPIFSGLSAELVNKAEIFYFGVLSNTFLMENKNYLMELIALLIKEKIEIVTVFPIMNTYDRMDITEHTGGCIKSVYK